MLLLPNTFGMEAASRNTAANLCTDVLAVEICNTAGCYVYGVSGLYVKQIEVQPLLGG